MCVIRLSFISALGTPLVSDANFLWSVLVTLVIPWLSGSSLSWDDIAVFRVEGIPLGMHVNDSTRNPFFVEFTHVC